MKRCMSPDGMPLIMNPTHQVRITVCHLPNDEEGRLDALRLQDVQHAACVRRQRAIVERQHHFVIVQKQILSILHRPNPRVFRRAHGDDSARSERVRVAGHSLAKSGVPVNHNNTKRASTVRIDRPRRSFV